MDEDRSASFVELFFDLVFVFGITQVVASVHGHLDFATLWRAAIVLLLLWWAWTQYTWLAGNVDFEHLGPRVIMLFATAGTFTIAVAVQGAWASDGVFFGAGYFAVMALFGAFYLLRAQGTDRMAGALVYIPRALAGAGLVLIGGFVDGDLRSWFWIGAVVVNLISAAAAGRFAYEIDPSHFAERHGLFVIIVLGEALIAVGATIVGQGGDPEFYVAGTAMLLIVLSMWWSYFDGLFRMGEKAMKAVSGIDRSTLARDAYTLLYYPLIAGVILFAVGAQDLLAHPELAMQEASRWAFVGGLLLFMGAQFAMIWRLTGGLARERLTLLGVLAVVGVTMSSASGAVLAVVTALVLVGSLAVESVRFSEERRSVRPG